jgi:hypothetical protein
MHAGLFWDFIGLILNCVICLEYVNHPLYYRRFVIAQFTKLLQVNVKKISLFHHCPNGFHDYAVWFGFFNAVVHLLLHGFIKPTYFYLERKWGIRNRKTNTIKIKPVQAVIVLFFGILFSICLFDRKGTE